MSQTWNILITGRSQNKNRGGFWLHAVFVLIVSNNSVSGGREIFLAPMRPFVLSDLRGQKYRSSQQRSPHRLMRKIWIALL